MAASSIARARLVVDLDVTVAHGENKCSADPLGAGPVSSLSPAVTLLVNHAVDIVERLGVAVTPAGEVARDSSRFQTARVATDPNKGTVVGVGDFDPHGVAAHFDLK